MKKILLLILCLFILTACDMFNNTPKKKTEEFLSKYQMLDEKVLSDLNTKANGEGLSTSNTEKYKEVIKRVYKNMKYDVKDEKVDGDNATTTVDITVYDLYKAQKESQDYLLSHQDEFNENGEYSSNLYYSYELNKMGSIETTVSYTIEIPLKKIDGKWEVGDLSNETLEKLHGLNNYET